MRTTRRLLLGTARWLALGLVLPAPLLVALEPRTRAMAAWRSLVRARESARAIGREYLVQEPHEADRERLLESLSAICPAEQAVSLDASELARRMARGVRRDFASGRTVSLRGWQLSRSEARLCALVALE